MLTYSIPMSFRAGRYKTRPSSSKPKPKLGNKALVKSGSAPSKRRAIRAAKPTPLMTQLVDKVLTRELETKYVAQDIFLNSYVLGTIDGAYANNRFQCLIPAIGQGVTSESRIGQKLTPVKLRVHVQYYFDNTYGACLDVLLRQSVITLKSWKSNAALTNGVQVSIASKLIDNGDGTTSAISGGSDYTQLTYPYVKEMVTKLKGDKIIRLAKNAGFYQQSGLTTGTDPHESRTGIVRLSFDVNCPPSLIYESNTANFPTNFNPLYAVTGALVSNGAQYTSALGTISSGTPATPIVRMSVRTEFWFKDA